ncbi:MAG: hypothetical protein EOP84_17465 [Verrucomicrobiaceae bacterium]|nr:MAG: hypothetical protein EOP84_17465 [Verrucomicrobiaceae bacterium]
MSVVTEEEFWRECDGFIRENGGQHGLLQTSEFDRAYEILMKHLTTVATFSDGGLDRNADLSSSRYFDPVASITVVRRRGTPDIATLTSVARTALGEIGRPFNVVFDVDGGYVGVYPERVLSTLRAEPAIHSTAECGE